MPKRGRVIESEDGSAKGEEGGGEGGGGEEEEVKKKKRRTEKKRRGRKEEEKKKKKTTITTTTTARKGGGRRRRETKKIKSKRKKRKRRINVTAPYQRRRPAFSASVEVGLDVERLHLRRQCLGASFRRQRRLLLRFPGRQLGSRRRFTRRATCGQR